MNIILDDGLKYFKKYFKASNKQRGSTLQQRLAPIIVNEFSNAMGTFRTRFGTVEDVVSIIKLQKMAYNGYLAWYERDFIEDIKNNRHAVYIILEHIKDPKKEPAIVGMCSGRFVYHKTHISHLMIKPSFQGIGLGEVLLKLWIDCSTFEGKRRIELEVRKSNETAQKLYLKYDFTYQQLLNYYYPDDYEDAWRMRRQT